MPLLSLDSRARTRVVTTAILLACLREIEDLPSITSRNQEGGISSILSRRMADMNVGYHQQRKPRYWEAQLYCYRAKSNATQSLRSRIDALFKKISGSNRRNEGHLNSGYIILRKETQPKLCLEMVHCIQVIINEATKKHVWIAFLYNTCNIFISIHLSYILIWWCVLAFEVLVVIDRLETTETRGLDSSLASVILWFIHLCSLAHRTLSVHESSRFFFQLPTALGRVCRSEISLHTLQWRELG